jgi:hypothetical protein
MKAPKPLDLPPKVARAFVKDMKAFFPEENPTQAGRGSGPSAARLTATSGIAIA